ncbi:MAG TPA: hypothetical protein VGW80_01990 [Solirubrobacterales bacterium]|jgi:hypothetical protein|nr:hypothetical protein [Solirubrobacterales bacterium]
MPDIPLSSLLGSDGTALVGEAATLEFTLKYVPHQPEGAIPLPQLFHSAGFAAAVQESLQQRVRERFGKHYFVDKLSIDPGAAVVGASISTLLDERVSLQQIAKRTAATAQAVREDLLDAAGAASGVKPWIEVNWNQGAGMFDPNVLSANTPSGQLEARLAGLRKRKRVLKSWRNVLCAIGLVLISFLLISSFDSSSPRSLFIFYGIFALGAAAVVASQMSDVDSEAQELGTALDLGQIDINDAKTRPERLFREHTFELKRYYDQTLSQGRTIYFVGLGCLLLGFAVIGASLWLVIEGGRNDSEEKVIVGVLGALAGILADYIAVVYLKMFSETIRAVADFHRRFVVTHHLHFGNVLASMIEKSELREQTLATMAQRLTGSESAADTNGFSGNGVPTASGGG